MSAHISLPGVCKVLGRVAEKGVTELVLLGLGAIKETGYSRLGMTRGEGASENLSCSTVMCDEESQQGC